MKLSDVFTTNYLKAADLPDEGQEFTILSVGIEQFGEKKEEKAVASFEETKLKLVINKTNWNTIVSNLNEPDSDDWVGRKITLAPAMVEFKGDSVLAIRVKADLKAALERARGKKAGAGSSSDTDDDVPF